MDVPTILTVPEIASAQSSVSVHDTMRMLAMETVNNLSGTADTVKTMRKKAMEEAYRFFNQAGCLPEITPLWGTDGIFLLIFGGGKNRILSASVIPDDPEKRSEIKQLAIHYPWDDTSYWKNTPFHEFINGSPADDLATIFAQMNRPYRKSDLKLVYRELLEAQDELSKIKETLGNGVQNLSVKNLAYLSGMIDINKITERIRDIQWRILHDRKNYTIGDICRIVFVTRVCFANALEAVIGTEARAEVEHKFFASGNRIHMSKIIAW